VPEDLQHHVAGCDICNDLGVVAQALRDDHQLAIENVRVPSASLVWWRAEIRARQQAVRVASRPIAWVQAVAVLCSLGGAVALLSRIDLSAWLGVDHFQWLRAIPQQLADLAPLYLLILPIGLLVAMAAFLALYFVLSDE
jgi:hypothetical protein